jgi:23S rRNA (guanosine2251-2'-O)-methyltransferase
VRPSIDTPPSAGSAWLYGRQVVKTVLSPGARRPARRLVATASGRRAFAGLIPERLTVDVVDETELERLTASRDHQGVAVQVDEYRYANGEELLAHDLLVVLDEVSDPHNLGAVARSALAAGAGGLVLPRHRAAHVTAAAVKASAGALELLPVAVVGNVVGFLQKAKRRRHWVYGAASEAHISYLELDLRDRVTLVFGAEGRGLRPLVARECDAVAAIPIEPAVESLNVSVAAAVLLFEARRQRGDGGKAPRILSRQGPRGHPGQRRGYRS